MTDTEALRRALDRPMTFQAQQIIEDAARRWLALAEGDEVVVRRLAKVIYKNRNHKTIVGFYVAARAVLAAITEEGE